MRAAGRRLGPALAAALLLGPARAEPDAAGEPPGPLSLDVGEPSIHGEFAPFPAELPEGFGGTLAAVEALAELHRGRAVRARELAEQILARDPDSLEGHCLLGLVYHRAEGNLPRALHHLGRSRELFEARHGRRAGPGAPWFWHLSALQALARVSGEMGHDADKVAYLAERDALYQPARPADAGWSLVRLREYQAARLAIESALRLPDQPSQHETARTARCVLEAELFDREAAFAACLEAVEMHGRHGGDPVLFTNAAEAALGMLDLERAEQLNLEATRRPAEAFTNPWANLLHLYLGEGRTAEALGALREMIAWRESQPAFVHNQTWAVTDLAAAAFLAVLGRERDAARIAARAVERPDRYGSSSDEARQREAAAALLHASLQRTLAERARERASWSTWPRALAARARGVGHRISAWASARRAAAFLAEARILESTLRPYLVDTVVLPEWLQPELVGAVGTGVARAALAAARANETLAGAAGYLDAFEVEIAAREGRAAETLRLAERALARLPEGEALLRTRVAVHAARAALRSGAGPRAEQLFELALAHDPGAVRRLGAALPCRFEGRAGLVSLAALELLRGSPRLARRGAGFVVRVEERAGAAEACLLSPGGAVLACAAARPRPDEEPRSVARRLAQSFHEAAFAPRVDLTQADIDSLDGSPTMAGGRHAERARLVLSDLLGP